MTSPLPPKYTYINGSQDSSLFWKKTDAITSKSPMVVESGDKAQKITLTPGPTTSIELRNTTPNPDDVTLLQMNSLGEATLQTVAGVTKLLDPLVVHGNGLQNGTASILGPSGANLAIKQTATNTTLTNSYGSVGLYMSSLTMPIVMQPTPGKAGSVVIYNSTIAGASSIAVGVSANGEGNIDTSANKLVLADPQVTVGNSLAADPILQLNGTGGLSRVYDGVYNPSVVIGPTFTTGYGISGSSDLPLMVSSGIYHLQARAHLLNDTNIVFGEGLKLWIQKPSPITPNEYIDGSEIHIMSTMMLVPGIGNTNKPTFVSTDFEIPYDDTWAIWIEAVGGSFNLGTPGTAGIEANLCKVK